MQLRLLAKCAVMGMIMSPMTIGMSRFPEPQQYETASYGGQLARLKVSITAQI